MWRSAIDVIAESKHGQVHAGVFLCDNEAMKTGTIGQGVCLAAVLVGANLGCGAMKGGSAKAPEAAAPSTVEITNKTEVPICEVYALYDADSDKEGGWGQNHLEAGKQLAPGETLTINIVKQKGNIDFLANDCDGNMVMRRFDYLYIDPGKNELAIEIPEERETPLAAPSESSAESEVSLFIKNDCSDKVEYCALEPSGTQNMSDLSGGSQQQFEWEIGTEIKQRDGSNCGDLIHTVTAEDKDQTIVICQ